MEDPFSSGMETDYNGTVAGNDTGDGYRIIPGNHTGGLYEYQTSKLVNTLVTCYIQPVICCCGLLGNSMILVVLTRYRVRRTVTTSEKVVHAGLLTMAASDLLFNLSVLPLAFVSDQDLLLPAGSFKLFYRLYSRGLITTFSLTSTWLIIITAGLRYVGVCHPLRARYLITRKAIFTSIAVIIVVCVLGNLPEFWTLTATPMGDGLMLVDLGPFSHHYSRGVVYSWIRAAASIFIPGILLIYFNTRLLMALHVSRRLHQDHVLQSTMTTRRENGASNRLTRTLIAVIVMFIALVYPDSLLDFFIHIAPVFDVRNNESVMIARDIVNTLQIANYAFNFILYCVMNASFRRALRELICWCLMSHSRKQGDRPRSKHCQKFLHPLLKPTEFETSTDMHRTAITMTTACHTRVMEEPEGCTEL